MNMIFVDIAGQLIAIDGGSFATAASTNSTFRSDTIVKVGDNPVIFAKPEVIVSGITLTSKERLHDYSILNKVGQNQGFQLLELEGYLKITSEMAREIGISAHVHVRTYLARIVETTRQRTIYT